MNFTKTILLSFLPITLFAQVPQNKIGIKGYVLDKNNSESLIGSIVYVTQNGISKGGSVCDEDGYFYIYPLDTGTYTIHTIQVGYYTDSLSNIKITNQKINSITFKLKQSKNIIVDYIRYYKAPLIDSFDPDKTIYTSEQIEKMPH